MNTKRIGNYGELKVAAFLVEKGYSVLTELGDISKIDLVVHYKGKLLGIQVKASSKDNGAYPVRCRGVGYKGCSVKYNKEDCDVFAVYCIDDDTIAWIGMDTIASSGTLVLRVDPPKNNQSDGIRLLADYMDFEKALDTLISSEPSLSQSLKVV